MYTQAQILVALTLLSPAIPNNAKTGEGSFWFKAIDLLSLFETVSLEGVYYSRPYMGEGHPLGPKNMYYMFGKV